MRDRETVLKYFDLFIDNHRSDIEDSDSMIKELKSAYEEAEDKIESMRIINEEIKRMIKDAEKSLSEESKTTSVNGKEKIIEKNELISALYIIKVKIENQLG